MSVNKNKLPLKLYRIYHLEPDYEGYDADEVRSYMESLGKLDEWGKWYDGSTGAIDSEGRYIVYRWDVERFLGGGANID